MRLGGTRGAGTGRGTAGVEAGEVECWAEEGYEEDRARGLDAAYLKFAARLARYPEQCARWVGLGGRTVRNRPAERRQTLTQIPDTYQSSLRGKRVRGG